MNSKLTLYEKLELLPPNSLKPNSQSSFRWLSCLVGQLLQGLAAADEPRITQTDSTQTGEPRFNAYDPITRESIRGVSEAEIRIWLEQRHRQAQQVSQTDPYVWLERHHWRG